MAEFFAVSMEVFFESPELMHERVPNLFYHTCIMLNQFPLGKEGIRDQASALLKSISTTAERVLELQVDPAEEDKQWSAILSVLTPLILKLAVILILAFSGSALFIVYVGLSIWIAWDIKRLIRLDVRGGNSLWFYNDGLAVLDPHKKEVASFHYEKLALIEIYPLEGLYSFTFTYPVQGEIRNEEYTFHFSQEGIEELRSYMQGKSTPVRLVRLAGEGPNYL